MLKKIMLGIVAVIVLAGVGNLAAKEDREKSGGKQKGQAKKLQQQEGMEQRYKGLRPGQQMFNRWFNALIKAHREDDRETMGQLLRKMNQFRQRMRKGRDALGERMRTFRGWPGAIRGQAGRFHDDSGKWGRRFLRGGMGRWGRKFLCRSMGGRSWKFRRRGICRPRHGIQRRGTGRWGRGFPSRGMGRWGQSIQRGGEPGIPCRVMGGWQRGIPKGHRGYESHGFRGRGMRDRREEKRRSEWDW